jgi:hypothetical protein
MNAGGRGLDAMVSRPPRTASSVGGAIVVGARESRVQGEGRQGIDVLRTSSRRSPWEALGSPAKLAAVTNEGSCQP